MQEEKRIAVFGSFLTEPHSAEYRMADELGYLLATNGFKVMCGGNGGITSAVVSGVTRGGGNVLGISLSEAQYPRRSAKPHPSLTETVIVGAVAERLECFAAADGYVFFPGGIGSLAEFAFVWHSLQVAADFDRPMILFSRRWERVMAALRREQMVKSKYFSYVHLCGEVKEAVAVLTHDYSLKYGDPDGIYHKDGVLFDLDGTVVESPEEEFVRACENVGYFFPLSAVIASFRKAEAARHDVPRTMAVLECLGIDAGSARGIAERVDSGLGRIPPLYADATDALRYFKENGFSTGGFSSRPLWQMEEILSTHGLSGLFDVIVSLVPPTHHPGGNPLAEILERRGLHPEWLVQVGMQLPEERRAIDVDSIVVDRHLTRILDDRAPKIRSLEELRHLVKRRGALREVRS